MKKIVLALSALSIPASQAATQIIDNFQTGPTGAVASGTLPTPATATSVATPASAIGNTRIGVVHVASGSGNAAILSATPANPGPPPIPNTVGQFRWSADSEATSTFGIYYGYNDYNAVPGQAGWIPQATASGSDLNADLTDGGVNDRITVRVLSADLTDSLNIGVITNRGTANEAVSIMTLPVIGGGGPPQTLTFDFSGFAKIGGPGAIDFTNVDQIIVEVTNPLGSADWTLGTIQVIPEPSSALLGLVGLLGLARRRR